MHTSKLRVIQSGIRTVSVSRIITLEVPHFIAEDQYCLAAWIADHEEGFAEFPLWEPVDNARLCVTKTNVVGHPFVVDHPMTAADRQLYGQ